MSAGLSARTITDSPELVCSSSPPAARSGECINPDAQRTALATFSTADHIQTVPADVQRAPRSGSSLPGETLRSGFIRRGSSSSEVSFIRSARRAAILQENVGRQGIRKLRTHPMELSVQFSERRLSVAPLFQETLENSPILICCFCRHSEYEIFTQTSFSVALMWYIFIN